ncbi:hypothetical protein C1637_08580 [Chryseobacterium lactis]|uniref:DUF4868 domain-containing protein n=1 Tax=Chryseobacterium lactis TaxID=1241981 RepID=A0A3G6RMM7_CHRLC|nr:hypothetical protein [Chryseobacterium lactis]AZA82408.1 hypothetical protein EG342_11115 [Chryseobacterium lactis]AZB02790.1 hypothetical protein EG341_01975 [Chryseobacterium lactis]PNW13916.1 hypothetical protein C1637_08580 [Chryseobacterium lactis]
MEANLPEIEICDTIFQFDIDNLVLIEKKDPYNLLFFNEMLDHLTHYEFFYSKINKNTPTERRLGPADDIFNESEKSKEEFAQSTVKVSVPRIAEIDPEGMMRKYGCSRDDIKNKTDFDIIVNQDVLRRRVSGERVKIDIAGIVYEIDAITNSLRPLNGDMDSIKLTEYRYDYFIDDESCYYLYCNMNDGRIVDLLRDQTVENSIEFKVPDLTNLDPIAVINNFHFLTDLELYYQDLKMFHIAEPSQQQINGNALLNSDFTVKNPDLKTLILISENDPDFTLKEYRNYIIASSNESRLLDKDLTVIFEKNNKPENAQVIIPASKQSTNNIEQGINEAMKHIDILVDNPNIISNSSVLSNALSINQYLELYHSQGKLEAKKLLPKNEKSAIENPQKGTRPKF